jgi:hypothetical protein
MLTDQQKAQVRRHLGFPVVGNPVRSAVGGSQLLGGFQGYRFFQVFGTLEWRMNWMMPIEDAIITGLSSGTVMVSTSPLQKLPAGLVVSIEIAQASLTSPIDEVISYTTSEGDDIYIVGVALANAILANANLMNAGFFSASPLSGGTFAEAAKPPSVVQPFPGVQITSPADFTMTVTSSPPCILSASGGGFDQPITSINRVVYKGYLPILGQLEGSVASAVDNLDTEKADVWTARRDEVKAKHGLYNLWRGKLSEFLEIPLWEDTPYSVKKRFGSGAGGRRIIV